MVRAQRDWSVLRRGRRGIPAGGRGGAFTPANTLGLPRDKFLVVLSSRIGHEKDPETVLRAVAITREGGLDTVVLNLGGGHREFLALAASLGFPDRLPHPGCSRARPCIP